jgi:hypothetical protein
MPSLTFSLLTRGTAKKAGLIADGYPPGSSVITSSTAGKVERSKDVGLGQFRIALVVLRFAVVGIPAGASMFTYELLIGGLAKNDADTRMLRIDNYEGWSGTISTGDYEEAELSGDAARVALSALSAGDNTVSLSGLPDVYNGTVTLRLCIDGDEPTGLDDISASSFSLRVTYSNSPTPGGLNIDGNAGNGISVDRTVGHRFGFSVGQPIHGWNWRAKRVSSGSWDIEVSQTTANQYYDVASGTFTSGADNNWQWQFQAIDAEDNASAWSETKSFVSVGHLSAPTVSPSGTATDALLTITATGADSHTQEQYQIFEGATKIYDTGRLTQTGNSHAMSSGYFTNGVGHLEDGHTYTLHYYYYDSAGNIGHGSASITVLFTPPNQPAVVVTPGESFININYDNPAGGATVDRVDILYAAAYDARRNPGGYDPALNPTAAFSVLKSDLEPSGDTDNPNYQWFGAASLKVYYFKARAWSGMAYIDSEVAGGSFELDAWIALHAEDDPANTVLVFEGWVTSKAESDWSAERTPRLTAELFLNRAAPSVDRELTTAGVQVATEIWHVTLITINDPQFDPETLRDDAEDLLKRGGSLVLRTNEQPTGRVKTGSVTALRGPTPLDTRMLQYVFNFDFVVTG